MIATVMGMTMPDTDGAATSTPSTAESTEMAGVIMLSPKNSEAPKMPSAASIALARAPPGRARRRIKAINAMMPPSPSLARMTSVHVGDHDDHHDRPEDQRDDAVHVLRRHLDAVRVRTAENRLHGIQRAGAEVAEHDAKRTDRESTLRR